MTLHFEILPPEQRALWSHLGTTRDLGMVLYGGTAIALHLGHRESVDFDFFTEQDLDRAAIQLALPFTRNALVVQDAPDTWVMLAQHSQAESPVKISFFGKISFGRFGEPICTEEGIQIASLDDLLATKLKVMLQRVEWKDYFDVAALLESGVDLSKGLSIARKMFGPTFQPSESLKALTYFKGGDLDRLKMSDRTTLVNAVRDVRGLTEIHDLTSSLSIPSSHEAGPNPM